MGTSITTTGTRAHRYSQRSDASTMGRAVSRDVALLTRVPVAPELVLEIGARVLPGGEWFERRDVDTLVLVDGEGHQVATFGASRPNVDEPGGPAPTERRDPSARYRTDVALHGGHERRDLEIAEVVAAATGGRVAEPR